MASSTRKKSNIYNQRFRPDDQGPTPSPIIPVNRGMDEDFDSLFVNWINYNRVPISASLINSVLSSADTGWSRDQAALVQAIMQKDPTILAHIQTRISVVLAAKWTITSDSGDNAKAKDVKNIFEKAGIGSLMRHLLDAMPTGYAGSLTNWAPGAGSINDFKPVHPVNWIFDMDGNPAVVTENGQERGLSEFQPYQFVFHKHSAMPGIPSTGGLVRPLVWTFFYKHFGMKHRARYLEKFGIPFLIGKVSDADFANESTRRSLERMLRGIGADGAGVFTKDSTVEAVSAGAQGANASYQEWFTYLDGLMTILILGQLASSSTASGMSNGQVQDKVRQDLFGGDCMSLMETIQRQVLKPLEWYKYRTEDLKFKIEFEPPEDLAKKMEWVKALEASGRKVKRQYIEETWGIPLEDDNVKPPKEEKADAPAGGGDLAAMLSGGAAPPAGLTMSDLSNLPPGKKKIFLQAYSDAYTDGLVSDSDLTDDIKNAITMAPDPVVAIDGIIASSTDAAVIATLSAIKEEVLANKAKMEAMAAEPPPPEPETSTMAEASQAADDQQVLNKLDASTEDELREAAMLRGLDVDKIAKDASSKGESVMGALRSELTRFEFNNTESQKAEAIASVENYQDTTYLYEKAKAEVAELVDDAMVDGNEPRSPEFYAAMVLNAHPELEEKIVNIESVLSQLAAFEIEKDRRLLPAYIAARNTVQEQEMGASAPEAVDKSVGDASGMDPEQRAKFTEALTKLYARMTEEERKKASGRSFTAKLAIHGKNMLKDVGNIGDMIFGLPGKGIDAIESRMRNAEAIDAGLVKTLVSKDKDYAESEQGRKDIAALTNVVTYDKARTVAEQAIAQAETAARQGEAGLTAAMAPAESMTQSAVFGGVDMLPMLAIGVATGGAGLVGDAIGILTFAAMARQSVQDSLIAGGMDLEKAQNMAIAPALVSGVAMTKMNGLLVRGMGMGEVEAKELLTKSLAERAKAWAGQYAASGAGMVGLMAADTLDQQVIVPAIGRLVDDKFKDAGDAENVKSWLMGNLEGIPALALVHTLTSGIRAMPTAFKVLTKGREYLHDERVNALVDRAFGPRLREEIEGDRTRADAGVIADAVTRAGGTGEKTLDILGDWLSGKIDSAIAKFEEATGTTRTEAAPQYATEAPGKTPDQAVPTLEKTKNSGIVIAQRIKDNLAKGLYNAERLSAVHQPVPQGSLRESDSRLIENASAVGRRGGRGVSQESRDFRPGEGKESAHYQELKGKLIPAEAPALRQWADEKGLLLDDKEFSDKWHKGGQKGGAEANVHHDKSVKRWFKRNDLTNNLDYPDFFNRLTLHNRIFPEAPYRFEGFSEHNGMLTPIISQPDTGGRKATQTAIRQHMLDKGFREVLSPDGAVLRYVNDELGVIVEDLHDNNAHLVKTEHGDEVAVFDPVIELDPAGKTARLDAWADARLNPKVKPQYRVPPSAQELAAFKGDFANRREAWNQLRADERRTLADEMTRMLGRSVTLEFVPDIAEKLGAVGRYLEGHVMIKDKQSEPWKTLDHEALHAVEDLFLTPAEIKALREDLPFPEARADYVANLLNHMRSEKGVSQTLEIIFQKIADAILRLAGFQREVKSVDQLASRLYRGYYAKNGNYSLRTNAILKHAKEVIGQGKVINPDHAKVLYRVELDTRLKNAYGPNPMVTAGEMIAEKVFGKTDGKGLDDLDVYKAVRNVAERFMLTIDRDGSLASKAQRALTSMTGVKEEMKEAGANVEQVVMDTILLSVKGFIKAREDAGLSPASPNDFIAYATSCVRNELRSIAKKDVTASLNETNPSTGTERIDTIGDEAIPYEETETQLLRDQSHTWDIVKPKMIKLKDLVSKQRSKNNGFQKFFAKSYMAGEGFNKTKEDENGRTVPDLNMTRIAEIYEVSEGTIRNWFEKSRDLCNEAGVDSFDVMRNKDEIKKMKLDLAVHVPNTDALRKYQKDKFDSLHPIVQHIRNHYKGIPMPAKRYAPGMYGAKASDLRALWEQLPPSWRTTAKMNGKGKNVSYGEIDGILKSLQTEITPGKGDSLLSEAMGNAADSIHEPEGLLRYLVGLKDWVKEVDKNKDMSDMSKMDEYHMSQRYLEDDVGSSDALPYEGREIGDKIERAGYPFTLVNKVPSTGELVWQTIVTLKNGTEREVIEIQRPGEVFKYDKDMSSSKAEERASDVKDGEEIETPNAIHHIDIPEDGERIGPNHDLNKAESEAKAKKSEEEETGDADFDPSTFGEPDPAPEMYESAPLVKAKTRQEVYLEELANFQEMKDNARDTYGPDSKEYQKAADDYLRSLKDEPEWDAEGNAIEKNVPAPVVEKTPEPVVEKTPEPETAPPATYNDMLYAAIEWLRAAKLAEGMHNPMKKAAIAKHHNMTTDGDLSTWISAKFGIDKSVARSITTDAKASKLKIPDVSLENFKNEKWAKDVLALPKPEAKTEVSAPVEKAVVEPPAPVDLSGLSTPALKSRTLTPQDAYQIRLKNLKARAEELYASHGEESPEYLAAEREYLDVESNEPTWGKDGSTTVTARPPPQLDPANPIPTPVPVAKVEPSKAPAVTPGAANPPLKHAMDYRSMKFGDLWDEVTRRNKEEGKRLSTEGKKADLVRWLIEDDIRSGRPGSDKTAPPPAPMPAPKAAPASPPPVTAPPPVSAPKAPAPAKAATPPPAPTPPAPKVQAPPPPVNPPPAAGGGGTPPPVQPPLPMPVPANAPAKSMLKTENPWQLLQRKIQYRQNRLKQVVDAIKNNKPVPEDRDPELASQLYIGKASEKLQNIKWDIYAHDNPDSFVNRMKAEDINVEDLGVYMRAQHADEANKHIAKLHPNDPAMQDGGSGMTKSDADIILASYHAKRKQITAFAAEFRKLVSEAKLKVLEDSGLLGKEDVARLRQTYQNYTSLKRRMPKDAEDKSFMMATLKAVGIGEKEAEAVASGSGFSLKGKEIKKRTGSLDLEVENPFFTMIHDYELAVVRAEKNIVSRKMLHLFLENPDILWDVERRQYLPQYDKNGDIKYMQPEYEKNDADVIEVKEGGKSYLIRINDEPLRDGIKNLGMSKSIKVLTATNNLMRKTITIWSPEFVITNAMRDFQESLIRQMGDKGVRVGAQFARTFITQIPFILKQVYDVSKNKPGSGNTYWGDLYTDLKKRGGKTGWIESLDLEAQIKDIKAELARADQKGYDPRKIGRQFGKVVENYNESVEMTTRLIAYDGLIKSGMGREEAARWAKEMTVDFNKKGQWGTFINNMWIFSNAGIQGTARMMSSFFDPNRRKKAMIVAGGVIGMGYMDGMLNKLVNGDEDDKQEGWQHDGYWRIPTGGGGTLQFKAPYGFGFFKALGNVMADMTWGNRKITFGQAATRTITAAARAFDPIGLVGGNFLTNAFPTAIRSVPMIAQHQNWAGNPDRPPQPPFSKVPESQLYLKTARGLSVSAAENLNSMTGGSDTASGWIDISPAALDTLIDQLGGGVGKFGANMLNTANSVIMKHEAPEMENVPFVRQFVGRPKKTFERDYVYQMASEAPRHLYDEHDVLVFEKYLDQAVDKGDIAPKDASKLRRNFEKSQLEVQASYDRKAAGEEEPTKRAAKIAKDVERKKDNKESAAASKVAEAAPVKERQTYAEFKKAQKEKRDKLLEEKSFADASHFPVDVVRDGIAIIKAKKLLDDAEARFNMLRDRLTGKLDDEPLELPEGTIAHINGAQGMTINHAKLAEAIAKHFGITPQRAQDIIKTGSIPKMISDYVKVILKKGETPEQIIAP